MKESIEVIGVPLDLGADRRGVDMGPSAIRYAGLSEKLRKLGLEVKDHGNIETPIAEAISVEHSNVKYLSKVREVCLHLAKEVATSVRADKLPLVLGGDHSIAIGTLPGIHNGLKKSEEESDFGVIWLDAHGDFNTPDISPSGNIHGMSLAFAAGQGTKWFPPPWPKRSVDPKKIVIVGARQLDPKEQSNLKSAGVKVLSMADIDRAGMMSVMTEAIRTASNGGRNKIHVSLDLDTRRSVGGSRSGNSRQGRSNLQGGASRNGDDLRVQAHALARSRRSESDLGLAECNG